MSLGEKCSLVSYDSPCGDSGTCHLQSRRPVHSSGPTVPRQITCSCGDHLPMDNCTNVSSKTVTNVKTIHLVPEPGMVAVIDHISVTPDKCPADTLVAAVSYWCQGKPAGCSVEEQLWRSAMPECQESSLNISMRWHYEDDYNSREIPCPSYGHGALEKKFSKFTGEKEWKIDLFIFSSSREYLLHQDCSERVLGRSSSAVLGLGGRALFPSSVQ